MKKLKQSLFITFLTIIVAFTIQAQNAWDAQSSGTTNALYSTFFLDENNGWATGANGTILHTTNGGLNWTTLISGVTDYFSTIFFLNELKGWVVGENGTILYTNNGGTNWANQATGITDYLISIYFVDTNHGWAISSSKVLHTSNGGLLWEEQTELSNIYEVHFTSITDGWICANYGIIYHTTDGGTTWDMIDTGTTEGFFTIFFLNNSTGWAAGSGGITARTTDGGENWEVGYANTSVFLYSINFVDANNGWIAGRFGTIVHTYDGGESWWNQTTGTSVDLQGICFANENDGWAVGNDGTILHTNTGGAMGIELNPVGSSSTDLLILKQNYPNPFKNSTSIQFELPINGRSDQLVVLKVYNLIGELTSTLFEGNLNAGKYNVDWDGKNQMGKSVSPGIYFLKLDSGDQSVTKKVTIQR